MIDKRSLLTGIGSLLAMPAIVHASSLMPVHETVLLLYGDGVHNDAAALSALAYGKAVRWQGEIVRHEADGQIVIPKARYRLVHASMVATRDLYVQHGTVFDWSGNHTCPVILFAGASASIPRWCGLSPFLTQEAWLRFGSRGRLLVTAKDLYLWPPLIQSKETA